VRAFAPRLRWLCASLALGAAACAATAPTPVLRIGTSGDYAPFSQSGEGFDVELAERMARDLGFEVEWVGFRWPELGARVAAGDFDVAMGGVTWRPERAVVGFMTRAVARGGPCVVGAPDPRRVGVNRGGVLERFARARFRGAEIRSVDRNAELAGLLARGEVDAIVTDSFEAPGLMIQRASLMIQRASLMIQRASLMIQRASQVPIACEPPLDRKVYWVAPARARELGPRIDAWLASHEQEVDALRARWLGGSMPHSDLDHLLDLLARRLAMMPAVARWKRARGLPIDDPAREARVLAAARDAGLAAGLAPGPVEALFRVQIALGSRIQASGVEPLEGAPDLDLQAQLRPELERLGERIVASAGRLAPLDAGALDAADWTPLAPWLDAAGRAQLGSALLALRRAD